MPLISPFKMWCVLQSSGWHCNGFPSLSGSYQPCCERIENFPLFDLRWWCLFCYHTEMAKRIMVPGKLHCQNRIWACVSNCNVDLELQYVYAIIYARLYVDFFFGRICATMAHRWIYLSTYTVHAWIKNWNQCLDLLVERLNRSYLFTRKYVTQWCIIRWFWVTTSTRSPINKPSWIVVCPQWECSPWNLTAQEEEALVLSSSEVFLP